MRPMLWKLQMYTMSTQMPDGDGRNEAAEPAVALAAEEPVHWLRAGGLNQSVSTVVNTPCIFPWRGMAIVLSRLSRLCSLPRY